MPDDARAMQDEPFGPLALLSPVRDLDEAIEKASSLPYGLAGYALTTNAAKVEPRQAPSCLGHYIRW